MSEHSYHDLRIMTKDIPRRRLFDLPYDYQVVCHRTTGWQLWHLGDDGLTWDSVAGEYARKDQWLILDVNGTEIVNSRDR